VFPDLVAPGTGSAQLSWFTFDTAVGGAERQRWYTLSGNVVSGQPNASLTIYQNTGGNFNAPPITNPVPVGTATLSSHVHQINCHCFPMARAREHPVDANCRT
jgi:hypothetical protein